MPKWGLGFVSVVDSRLSSLAASWQANIAPVLDRLGFDAMANLLAASPWAPRISEAVKADLRLGSGRLVPILEMQGSKSGNLILQQPELLRVLQPPWTTRALIHVQEQRFAVQAAQAQRPGYLAQANHVIACPTCSTPSPCALGSILICLDASELAVIGAPGLASCAENS